MIRLYRKHGKHPPDWPQTVKKSLPDHQNYLREALRFETLHLNSTERRSGFAQFAAHVLVSRAGKVVFPSCWTKFKDQLFLLSHSKCSYCEGEINSNPAGHVEHFNPKTLFPLLAYEWTNYFLACAGCNVAKGEKWPSRGKYVRPDQGDPAKLFRFEPDGTIHPARRSLAADKTIRDFGLSRKPLVNRRKMVIDGLLNQLKLAADIRAENPAIAKRLAANIFARISAPEWGYSAALTQSFQRVWPVSSISMPPKRR